jgi:hypothetical protein
MERALVAKNKLEMHDGSMPQLSIHQISRRGRNATAGLLILSLKKLFSVFFTSPKPKMLRKI